MLSFLDLCKPKIVLLLTLTALVGMLLTIEFYSNIFSGLGSLLGFAFLAASSAALNQIFDRETDKNMERTKKRPITSGKITVKSSLFYVFVLCLLAFLILIQFNYLTIMLGMGSMFLAFAYPFMKRITYWPQLFLGLTFNWGLIMAWTSINNEINVEIVILYMSAIFWTLGYDTIYGVQDMSEDEIIGLKSTSIKFKKNIKTFVTISYLLTLFTLIFVFKDFLGVNIFSFLILMFFLSLLFQIMKFKKSNSKSCLEAFKFNNVSGFILFFAIITINF